MWRGLDVGALARRLGLRAGPRGMPPDWTLPDDDAIRRILAERIDIQRQGVGIVVGVISPVGRRVVSYGVREAGQPAPVDGATVFEIGSITKVFTGLMLAEMAARGEVDLDQPVSELLPDGVTAPSGRGRQITLTDLATHTSGLPPLPADFAPANPENPYADYTVTRLYAFLAGHTLARSPGRTYAYSNLGAGLLGHVLALRAGATFEALFLARVAEPLGLRDTAITLSGDMARRLAVGHTNERRTAPYWDLPALAGAGALRSTADDLLRFLAAILEPETAADPLRQAIRVQTAVRRRADRETDVALGWHVSRTPRGDAYWHDGGTGGFRTFLGCHPASRTGVVVLTNHVNPAGGLDIGSHVLTGRPLMALAPYEPLRPIAVSAVDLEPLTGRYRVGPGAEISVSRDGDRLFAQITGQPRFQIFPTAPDRFRWQVADAELEFRRDRRGGVTSAVIVQDGRKTPARRLPS
jgi:CubicO group peptidase (beta-lactamase class C family)